MNPIQNHSLKIATIGFFAFSAVTGLLAPSSAYAHEVSGTATITIDNSAFAAASVNAGGGYPNGWIVTKHWNENYNQTGITSATAGGTTLATTGNTAMVFPVNTNTVTNFYPGVGPYGRSEQATTMEAGNIDGGGQIGLSGAWLLTSPGSSGALTPYDFKLEKSAGIWTIKTYDTAFSTQSFLRLSNVNETFIDGELAGLSGDLHWTGLWGTLVGANTNTVVGTFNLSPVPEPITAWMFGSGLLALIGKGRRKLALAA